MAAEETLFDSEAPKSQNSVNRILCATLDGVEARSIEVEATFTKGLPGFSVVGLAGNDIQESKERVKSALLTNDFIFPPLKITINLSPSDIRKSGTHFDLPIALLVAMSKEEIDARNLFVFGELGLDGRVRNSSALFPLILSLKERGLVKRAMVPLEAMEFLSHIPGVDFLPVATLSEAIEVMGDADNTAKGSGGVRKYDAQVLEIAGEKFYYETSYDEDFRDVKGQELAKRAALVAAAGMHNFLMEGSPGCGKSMIAKRVAHILPPLSEREILSIAKHRFLDGKTPDFSAKRPMRSPHHTATSASIFGGGSSNARIGEVALAHCGILFFDELPHFGKNILEALREPLQDRKVHIARVNSKISYDADFMFVAAMNPCPCGNLLSKSRECRCSEAEIKRYANRLSDPFLDRMDIFVTMQEVESGDRSGADSASMHREVVEAFIFRTRRAQSVANGKLSEADTEKFCILSAEAEDILAKAVGRFALSHRSIVSIKRVARTIADLDKSGEIGKKHILEALSYRRRK